MKKYLVEFDFGLHYAFGGSLEVLTGEELLRVENFVAKGSYLYLGEIEGKHSEIEGPLEASDFNIISENQEEIAIFEKLIGANYGAFSIIESIQEQTSN